MRFAVECGIPHGLGLLLRSKDVTAWHGYHLEEPYALIGTAEDCNVRLSDESIAPFHAYLQMLEGRLFVCDLTEQRGVLLDEHPVTAEWLDRAAELRVGRYDLRVAMVDAQPHAASRDEDDAPIDVRQLPTAARRKQDLILSMRNGGGRLQQVRSSRDVSLVGRSTTCKFNLGSSSVAKIHCSLVRTSTSVWIVDLGSDDGTFLNGERVRWAHVTGGSRIQVGRCRLDFNLETDSGTDHATSSALTPVGRRRRAPKHQLVSPPANGYSEQLIRDLVADMASSQLAAFDKARRMLMKLISSQKRVYAQQMESLKDQNQQLLELVRMLSSSGEQQQTLVNVLQQSVPETIEAPQSSADQDPAVVATVAETTAADAPLRAPPPDTDAEIDIDTVWVRGQLHAISENLKEEQERGVKKLLGGRMSG